MRPPRSVLAMVCGVCLAIGGLGCRAASREMPEAPAGPVRGVILMVGDGMGVATVTAARIHRGTLDGLARPADATLRVDGAPRSALVRTHSLDHMVTDSAAGITAMVAGAKTVNGAINVVPREDGGLDSLMTIVELAESLGMATGVVTTTRVTHATPAGCYAHILDRGQEDEIALALLPGGMRVGDGMEVVLGGGRRHFQPRSEEGAVQPAAGHHRAATAGREDGRDLLVELAAAGYAVVGDREELRRAAAAGASRLFGVFHESHMTYEVERDPQGGEPTLAEMTRAALDVLRRDPDGFFLLVEGGRIDHALHGNLGYLAVTEMLAFDDALGEVLALPAEETLVLLTADHDHTMVIAGYAPATAGVFSAAGADTAGRPYPVLLFGGGSSPGWASAEPPEEEDFLDPRYRGPAAVPLDSEPHGGMDVPLYGFGPRRILDAVPGVIENTGVFDILRAAVEAR